jgi:signal transduction histidine kinase/CheY-like chemotaxis protein
MSPTLTDQSQSPFPGRRATSLRVLTLGVLLVSFLTLALAQWISTRRLYDEGFEQQERSDAVARADQARALALARAAFLENYASDNGAWDDAFKYMHGTDPTLPDRIFVPESFRRMNLSAYAFVDPSFRPVRVQEYDPALQLFGEASAGLLRSLRANIAGGLQSVGERPVHGFAHIGGEFYAWGAAPIVHSDNSGPIAGYLILFSRFDREFLATASSATDSAVSLRAAPTAEAESRDTWYSTSGEAALRVRLPVGALDGGDSLQIQLLRHRSIHAIANHAAHYVLISTLVFGALVSVLALLFVERRLLRPIVAASQTLTRIGQTGDLSTRLESYSRSDEIGQLMLATNGMLAQLENKRDAEAARDAALRESQMKSEFLARMSHEIRTPMNAVMGMTELLKTTSLTPRQMRLAETAHRSAELLLGVINDILDFSKLEAGYFGLVIDDFNFRELVEETVELLAERAQANHLELILSIDDRVPPVLRGDAARLRQVLTNLIANAIKFTEAGEVSVRVALRQAEAARATIEIAVADTGIGMHPEVLEEIFEPFTQADGSTTRRFEGTGLGLAIASHLVRLMGGTVTVQSEPGEGSTFKVCLILESGSAAIQGGASKADLSGIGVLVVDDNATNREVLDAQLSAAGAKVICADSGSAALLTLCTRSDIAVLVTDRRMPEMDGDQLVEHVRRLPQLDRLRIIMLSSMDMAVSPEMLPTSSIQAHLTKPVRESTLTQTVAEVLKSARQGPAVRAGKPASLNTPIPDHLQLRVLLAEDNAVNREVAAGMLQRLGCTVVEATNGLQALERFSAERIDVILMDCQMPELDGFGAAMEIRRRESEEQRPPVPIIALTANALPGDRDRCLLAGMNDFLPKPFMLAQLAQMLEPFAHPQGSPEEGHSETVFARHGEG